jgi:hypothetical protein
LFFEIDFEKMVQNRRQLVLVALLFVLVVMNFCSARERDGLGDVEDS